jgi:mycothiol system anti-sigma-R factor
MPTEGPEADNECAGVLRDVWQFLDNELDPANRAAVEAHLDGCSPCLEEANIDAKLKALLHAKCGGDRAPQQLREKLVSHLRSVTVTSDGAGSFSRTTVTTEEFRTVEH